MRVALLGLKELRSLAQLPLLTPEQSYHFACSYQRIFARKEAMAAAHYEFFEVQSQIPPEEVEGCYQAIQERALATLKEGKFGSTQAFLESVEIAQHHKSLQLSDLTEATEKYLLSRNDADTGILIPRALVAYSSIYKVRFEDQVGTLLLQKVLQTLAGDLSSRSDLPSTCLALGKIKILDSRLMSRLEQELEQAGQSVTFQKHLMFSALDLYSRLPQQYYPHRLNSYFMRGLSSSPLNLNEKVRVLTALARLEDDESSQFRLISPEAMQLFISDITSHRIAQLNFHSKVRLFNFLKQRQANISEQVRPQLLPPSSIKQLQQAYAQLQSSRVSNFQNEIEECLKEVGYSYQKETFLETYFIDFLIDRQAQKTVLEVDGPFHFWKAGSEYLPNRDNNKREGWWKSRGYCFGSIPFYLWQRCHTAAHRRVLVRAAVDGRQPSALRELLG